MCRICGRGHRVIYDPQSLGSMEIKKMTQDEIIKIITALKNKARGMQTTGTRLNHQYFTGMQDACIDILDKIERGEIPDDK